jgi:hypothetical protein
MPRSAQYFASRMSSTSVHLGTRGAALAAAAMSADSSFNVASSRWALSFASLPEADGAPRASSEIFTGSVTPMPASSGSSMAFFAASRSPAPPALYFSMRARIASAVASMPLPMT